MCLRLMDAVPRDGVTAAVLHSPILLFSRGGGVPWHGAGRLRAAGGLEESGRVGVGVLDAVLRTAVRGLEEGG